MPRVALILLFATSTALAAANGEGEKLAVKAYYFPRPDSCTVMVDFQPAASTLQGVRGEARAAMLASTMLREFAPNAAGKCKSAGTVRLLAVMIKGVDSYGRPDFGNRANLLRLEGDALRLGQLANAHSTVTLARIRSVATVESLTDLEKALP